MTRPPSAPLPDSHSSATTDGATTDGATTDLSAVLAKILADPRAVVHFVGVGGSGMSALAQLRGLAGGRVTGSDRSFDRGEQPDVRAALERASVHIVPQDGSAIGDAALVIVSTAVESSISDVDQARRRGLPIAHRSQLLAHYARASSVAVAGTSGKSTVTAMIFEILRFAGRDPSLATGGPVVALIEAGMIGNATRGEGPLVFEADESDGTLVRHKPEFAVLLNLHRDHMEPDEVMKQFRAFRANVRGPFIVSDDAALQEFRSGALVFGFSAQATVRATTLRLDRDGSTFRVGRLPIRVPIPGEHNAWNALAAFATTRAMGVRAETAAAALSGYRGVHRRFQRIGEHRGVLVIDDFAHNPDKLRAAIRAASIAAPEGRVLAFFQPHGFAPTRFMRAELVDKLAEVLGEHDRLWLGDIFFAGGTAIKDIHAKDIVEDLSARGVTVDHAPDRARFVQEVAAAAKNGDVILILGARDPSLSAVAVACLDALSGGDPIVASTGAAPGPTPDSP